MIGLVPCCTIPIMMGDMAEVRRVSLNANRVRLRPGYLRGLRPTICIVGLSLVSEVHLEAHAVLVERR